MLLLSPTLGCGVRADHTGKGAIDMNEIAQLLQQKFGMNEDQAREAGRAVLQLIQSKIPEQYQGMLSSLVGSGEAGGGEPEPGAMSSVLGAASGLLAGRKS